MGTQEELARLGRAIDGVLIANHGLLDALKPGHLPFSATLTEGVARYGASPLLHLWAECKAVEELRIAWTGKASVPRAIPESAGTVPAGTESAGTESAGTESGPIASESAGTESGTVAAPASEPVAADA